jgi:hypothetical protein
VHNPISGIGPFRHKKLWEVWKVVSVVMGEDGVARYMSALHTSFPDYAIEYKVGVAMDRAPNMPKMFVFRSIHSAVQFTEHIMKLSGYEGMPWRQLALLRCLSPGLDVPVWISRIAMRQNFVEDNQYYLKNYWGEGRQRFNDHYASPGNGCLLTNQLYVEHVVWRADPWQE